MSFPENFIKGIPQKADITNAGLVGSHVFHFIQRENQGRDDGYIEQSINWDDDHGAIVLTLNQKRNERIQFNGGAALISRNSLDEFIKRPIINKLLSYERAPFNGNPYHGNLLLKQEADKPSMKAIAAHIASMVDRIQPQEEF